MDKNKVSKFNTQHVFTKIIKYGSHILFVASIITLSYLSFVDNLDISPDIRNITTIAVIAMFLNYMVWTSYYQNNYNMVLTNDINNKDYCVHKRYWMSRKDWKYEDLQKKIRDYNTHFITSWIQDICDQLSLTEAQIYELYTKKKLLISKTMPGIEKPVTEELTIRQYNLRHRKLIKHIVQKKYPQSGITTPRDLLYILSVGKSPGMKININAAETFYKVHAVKKFIVAMLGTFLAASLLYEFIDGQWESALFKLITNLVLLFMSFFTGSVKGAQGGQIKLSIAEEVSEKLEEWKGTFATEIPFRNDLTNLTNVSNDNTEPNGVSIEIT